MHAVQVRSIQPSEWAFPVRSPAFPSSGGTSQSRRYLRQSAVLQSGGTNLRHTLRWISKTSDAAPWFWCPNPFELLYSCSPRGVLDLLWEDWECAIQGAGPPPNLWRSLRQVSVVVQQALGQAQEKQHEQYNPEKLVQVSMSSSSSSPQKINVMK